MTRKTHGASPINTGRRDTVAEAVSVSMETGWGRGGAAGSALLGKVTPSGPVRAEWAGGASSARGPADAEVAGSRKQATRVAGAGRTARHPDSPPLAVSRVEGAYSGRLVTIFMSSLSNVAEEDGERLSRRMPLLLIFTVLIGEEISQPDQVEKLNH